MNRKFILYLLGKILCVEAILMLLPLTCAIIYREKSIISFAITIVFASILGLFLTLASKPKDKTFFAKEGFVIVALSWLTLSIVGALPFFISGAIPNFINAFFETVSGFTTTGATILNGEQIETMEKGLLFWRSFTHWVGGMGILVLVMAIVPTESGRSIHIVRAEMPGPIVGKLVPKLKSTAKILYLIYIFLTLSEIILLLAGGMNFFESLIHTFGTAGTGGFSSNADSIGSYSPYIQWVITIFMLIFGINFNIYYLIIIKKIRTALKSEEIWCYLGIVAIAISLITYNTYHLFENFWEALRQSAFQVSSIISTTGFTTANYNAWPGLSKGILLLLMFIGACAGSTAGGIKVSRIILLFKRIRINLRHLLHPRSAESARYEGKRVEADTLNNVTAYFTIYFFCFTIVLFILLFEPFDLETNISAVAACFNNVGPGLSIIGPDGNYEIYSSISKIALSFAMLLGRLEIYPIILLFSPSNWLKRRKLKIK